MWIDPVTAQRGFATVGLISAWTDIVGARYAGCSRPERIVWPRGEANGNKPGVLVIRVEGPRALLLQHETAQIIERINTFLGHGAVGSIKIVQGTVTAGAAPRKAEARPLDAVQEASLVTVLADIEDGGLRSALDRLGRSVLAATDKKS